MLAFASNILYRSWFRVSGESKQA